MPDLAPSPPRHRLAVLTSFTVWGARAAWLAAAVLGGRAVGDALADRSGPVQVAGTVGAWLGWALGAVALAVPSVATLTVARTVVPAALAVTVATVVFGADVDDVLALGLPAVLASVLVAAAETGRTYLQASAYGDEQRFGLRPPLGYLAATVLTWLVWVTAVITAWLAWPAGAWWLAAATTLLAVAATITLPRRWHQLSRRWLVFVPAGLVVHDPVILSDSLLLTRAGVRRIAVNELGSAAVPGLDLTGPTPGLAVEVGLHEPVTTLLARRPSERRGRTASGSTVLVSPTRPGAVLTEAAKRGIGSDRVSG